VLPADIVAEYGSPLWVVNLDVLRDRWRTLAMTWRSVWPDVHIAYAYKANRHPAIVGALVAAGAGQQVSSSLDYDAARTITDGDGRGIVVQGHGIPGPTLERAAADRALVIADSAGQLAHATAAGVRRLGLRVATRGRGQGPSVHGIPMAQIAPLVRQRPAGAPPLEALAMHLIASGFRRPPAEQHGALGNMFMEWPLRPERFAEVARALGSLAVRLGIPVVDVGGNCPPAPDESVYARAIAGALGSVGFDGRIIVEPGLALVGEAVELFCSVVAIKRLEDGTRCIVADVGPEAVAGAQYRWPHIDAAVPTEGPLTPALVIGPHNHHQDLLNPGARLPSVSEGDVLVLRRVGAYNQAEMSEHAAREAAVVVVDGGVLQPWTGDGPAALVSHDHP
jgi:diaminopimelate decarboxylase